MIKLLIMGLICLQFLDLNYKQIRLEVAKPYENQILEEYLEYYEYNPDVIGYIVVEGTDVDCPVFQSLEDYDYYLSHDIDREESAQGCIILDPDSEIGIGTRASGYVEEFAPSTNMLVHGHNMKSGTMFGALDRYSKESFAKKHPYIYFDSLYEHRVYEVFAATYTTLAPMGDKEHLFSEDPEEPFKYYYFNQAKSVGEFDEFYKALQAHALYEMPMDLKFGDEIITLSTCAYQVKDGRFAVFAKRIE